MRKVVGKFLLITILAGLISLFGISTALSLPVEVAPGYELEQVATGVVPVPTSIAFGPDGNLYASSMIGMINKVNTGTGDVSLVLTPGILSNTMGMAFHPLTGELYVSNSYLIPGGDPFNPSDVISRISIVNGGSPSTFVDELPSMFFEELPTPVTGSQGIDFDSSGNLYIAQGINDFSREAGDPLQSAILKIDEDGNVSVFASGLRSPYDVVVDKENKQGVATVLYAGDNGEGEHCEGCPDEDAPSRMYSDELNRVVAGGYYGWPDATLPGTIDPLWQLDRSDPTNGDSWPVPTGIEIKRGNWGSNYNPLFLALFNCLSLMIGPDVGTIEMFTGNNYSEKMTLALYVDAPIDVTMGPDGSLYFAEFLTGDIYRITPVPEPTTLILLGSGLAGLFGFGTLKLCLNVRRRPFS